MMNGMGGLFEIVLVLSLALGWGFIELRSNRRYKKEKAEKERQVAEKVQGPITSGGNEGK